MIKVEMHEIRSLVGCFWNTGNKEWEGILSKEFDESEVKIIKSDRAVILFRKSDFDGPVQSSSGNSPASR